ncbi:hypothetical protein [Sphingomonas agri]|uniref:hypothetical protein n=1 Tax=Sphingomonas agri TaxID=1813878 RepID=UPI00312022FC
MSQVNDPREGEFEAANLLLSEGLKTCRSVVSNYKALLSAEQQVSSGQADSDGGEASMDPGAER